MPLTPAIAERFLDLLLPSGNRVSFRVAFGPIRAVGQQFRCQVRFYGWGDSPPDIWGCDSLDAFVNALTLVHSILYEFVQRGGRILWPESNDEYLLDNFVSSPHTERCRTKRFIEAALYASADRAEV
jgi:hypothetical protein